MNMFSCKYQCIFQRWFTSAVLHSVRNGQIRPNCKRVFRVSEINVLRLCIAFYYSGNKAKIFLNVHKNPIIF